MDWVLCGKSGRSENDTGMYISTYIYTKFQIIILENAYHLHLNSSLLAGYEIILEYAY